MKKILIIDDQAKIRTLIGRAMETFGYAHRATGNSQEALLLCQTWKPDAILTDIFMPEKDGLEVIRELRKTLPGVVILAMSGGGGTGDLDVLRTAQLMGAKRVLAKPFPMQELKQALKELVGSDDSPPDTASENRNSSS